MLKKINFLYIISILFIYIFYYFYDYFLFNISKIYCYNLNYNYYKNFDEFKLYLTENDSVNEIYCANDSLSGVLNIFIFSSFMFLITELTKIV